MQNPDTTNPSESPVELQVTSVKKRPWSVTLLALIVLIISVINLIRFVLSVRYWAFLASLSVVSPLYLALTGLAWTAVGVVLLWGLWRPKPWAPALTEAVGLTYALYYWLDMIFLKDRPVSGAAGAFRILLPTDWLFPAILTVIGLALIVWVMSRTRVKAYFSVTGSPD